MEYHKIINLQGNKTPNQPSKLGTKNWVKTNNHSHGTWNTNIQIKFTDDEYTHVKGTITIPNNGIGAAPNNWNIKVIFKNCAPFTACISEINNTQVDYAKDIDVVMIMYNLIE